MEPKDPSTPGPEKKATEGLVTLQPLSIDRWIIAKKLGTVFAIHHPHIRQSAHVK